jgi:hypothetical protein
MYVLTVLAHSVMRWIVVVLGVVVVYRAVTGQFGRRPWTSSDTKISLGFLVALDVQLLIGTVLFIKSPITILGIHEWDLMLASRALRFYTLEHPILMLAAIALAHIAWIRIRRRSDSSSPHRDAAVFFGLALLLLLAAIPWPFLPYGRPLLSLLPRS